MPDVSRGPQGHAERRAVGELRCGAVFPLRAGHGAAAWDEILAHSEREMRAAIREVPPALFSEDFYDDCGRDTAPLGCS